MRTLVSDPVRRRWADVFGKAVRFFVLPQDSYILCRIRPFDLFVIVRQSYILAGQAVALRSRYDRKT